MVFLRYLKHKYSHIDQQDEEHHKTAVVTKDHPNAIYVGYWLAVCALVLAVTVGALGFWVGECILQLQSQSSSDTPAGKEKGFHSDRYIARTFGYNRSFTHAPSLETNRAWNSLFPKGMGFIVDPTGRLEAVGISVFHQLPCLDLLRHLYYRAESGTGPTMPDNNIATHPHRHASHCFDYLRQALMCGADSTMEPGNLTTKYVTGSGTVHECRDYDGLVAWTEERRLAVPPSSP